MDKDSYTFLYSLELDDLILYSATSERRSTSEGRLIELFYILALLQEYKISFGCLTLYPSSENEYLFMNCYWSHLIFLLPVSYFFTQIKSLNSCFKAIFIHAKNQRIIFTLVFTYST